jgi:Tol biopolymer transport system component
VFTSSRTGAGNLHLASLEGDLHEEVLVETPREKWATDWSRDGQDLLFVERGNATTGRDLWVLSMRDRRATVVLQTSADEEDARFSPDAKWIAYQSNESGRMEVYVQPFRRAAGKVPVSTAGGAQGRWRRDGKMLYYVSLDGNLMEVPVSVTASGIEVGNAEPLFRLSIGDPLESNMRVAYIAADDGKRFLVNTLMEASVAPITVLLNWKPRP